MLAVQAVSVDTENVHYIWYFF